MAPDLFVKTRRDGVLGLFANTAFDREAQVLPLHRASHLAFALRMWPLDRGVFLRGPSDLHSLVHHACMPTAYVDWELPGIRALRPIDRDQEITVNFLTIYEEISKPFECCCGAPACYGRISGFDSLSMDQRLQLEIYLSPYLKSVLTRQVLVAGARAS